MNRKIATIGLGKLGLPLAAVLGEHYSVVGIDNNVELTYLLNKGTIPYKEPNLKELLKKSNLVITNNYKHIKDCDTVFCIVPTPSKKDGSFSNEYLEQAIKSSSPYLKSDKHKMFVVTSTVMPGSCEQLKRKLPDNVDICYNPEFIRLGDVINGMKNPDFVLIGSETNYSGILLESIYEKITDAPVKRMDLRSAELAKMALNSYVTMKISFANVIDEIAESIGANSKDICDAIGYDKRIGKHYFNPGGAYGGPCFPRDNRAFAKVADEILNYSTLTDKINKHQAKRIGFYTKNSIYSKL